jgi:CRISPR-associated protein Csa1
MLMLYFALKDIKENTIKKLQRELGDPSRISIRGEEMDKVKLPSELSGRLLPVHLLANKYCPTNRDIFLKVVRNVPQPSTWSSYQGRVVHELCFKIAESIRGYIVKRNIIQKINLLRYIQQCGRKAINELTSDIDQEIAEMANKPSNTEKEEFLRNLSKLVRMESEIASTFVDYTIATNVDVHVDSEFQRIFPFQREISLNATPLGLSKGVKPDFVYSRGDNVVVGDIKTGGVKEFHKLVLAAYALAYEYEERVPVNFGVILNINFSNKRNVPIFKETEAIVISDKYRQAFLKLRDEKFEIVKTRKDPGLAPDESECADCPYFSYCRGT